MTPYYAVIFTSQHSDNIEGYSDMAARMEELARAQEGFIDMESVRSDGTGITVSYWTSLDAIKKWKANLQHLEDQSLGREKWYSSYRVRIAKVEREYGG